MKRIVYFFGKFERRSLLIAAAVILLLVNLGRWGHDTYQTRQEEVESKVAQLGRYQLVTQKAERFEKRLTDLQRAKEQVGKYFFEGNNDNKLSSAMQLRVQALVVKSGMQAESIRPLIQKAEGQQGKDGYGNAMGEVLIKARLAGTLSQFMNFVAELYRGKEYFEIQSVDLKPYRDKGLKILVDLKGFYIPTGKSGNSEEAES